MMLLRCPTDYALFVLAIPDAHGVLRGPRWRTSLLGQMFAVSSQQTLSEQLYHQAKQLSGRHEVTSCLCLEDHFAPQFPVPASMMEEMGAEERKRGAEDGAAPKDAVAVEDERSLPSLQVSMYVGRLVGVRMDLDPSRWVTFPEFLRDLPHTPYRRYYLQAWQVLMGGLKQDSKVLMQEGSLEV